MRKAIREAIQSNKPIYLFGSTKMAGDVLPEIVEAGGNVRGILNSNPERWGKSILGVPVMPPDVLSSENKNTCVLIISSFWEEIFRQIAPYGFKQHVNAYTYFNRCEADFALRGYEKEQFAEAKDLIVYGFELWKTLVREYGGETTFLCGPVSMGDFYIECKYIDPFLDRFDGKYVFVLYNNAEKSLARAYGYERIHEIYDPCAMNALLQFKMFCRSEAVHIESLFPSAMYYAAFSRLGEVRNSPLWTTYSISRGPYKGDPPYSFWYDLRGDVKPVYKAIGSDFRVDELFARHGLKEKNTVVISTDAKTFGWFSIPSPQFWKELVAFLLEQGYCVAMNAAKDGKSFAARIPVSGVQEVFFDIADARLFVERCGYFVALRSGLCDVVETARCEKHLLYPNINPNMRDGLHRTGLSSIHDEFHITQPVKEYIISENNERQILEDISRALARK